MKDSEENTTGVDAGLSDAVQLALEEAGGRGASSSEAAASLSQGLSVNVRKSEIETVEHTRDRNLVVSVYFGQRTGSASTSDYSPAAVKETVLAACNIAKWTEEDRCIGLADPERLAKDVMDLDLYHPWTPSVEEASSLALECEASALGADARIVNSEGASVDAHQGVEVYGNSLGFIGHTQKSRQGISCSVIAGVGDSMQAVTW